MIKLKLHLNELNVEYAKSFNIHIIIVVIINIFLNCILANHRQHQIYKWLHVCVWKNILSTCTGVYHSGIIKCTEVKVKVMENIYSSH